MSFIDHLNSEIQKIEATKASHLSNIDGLNYTIQIIDLILPVLKSYLESNNVPAAQPEAPAAEPQATNG